jgi:glycosyltransferase involved in cell wall biosynthesis
MLPLAYRRRVGPGNLASVTVRTAVEAAAERPPITGVGVYVRELRLALARQAPERLLFIGVRPEADPPVPAGLVGSMFPGGRRYDWLLRTADREARSLGAGLAHYTNGAAPIRPSVPYVLTLHDLSVFRLPHLQPFARLLTMPVLAIAARSARALIVGSDAVRVEVEALLRVPTGRIAVVPLATAWTQTPDRRASARGLGTTLERWGLEPEGYVLAVGTIEPRKNIIRLVAAFERLLPERPGLRLVLAGPSGWRDRAIHRAIRDSDAAQRIVLTGYLPEGQLQALTAAAGVFTYVSRYEGYGLPIIDAMAAGVPVVTSTTSAMPETAGGAAVLVDPGSVGAIAAGIRQAFDRRDELVAAGLRRVAGWTWDDVARATLEVYDAALSGRSASAIRPRPDRPAGEGSGAPLGSSNASGTHR